MTVLVIGDANADASAALERFPREGDDAAIRALGWGSGGAAVNVATAVALLGMGARLLARIGKDPAGDVALSAARAAGVDLGAIQRDEVHSTGLCFAAVSPSGERTFFSHRGANRALELPPASDLFRGIRWLHLSGHALLEDRQRDTSLALAREASARGVPVSLDLCLPLVRTHRTDVLDLSPSLAVLFANELEIAALLPSAAGDPVENAIGSLEKAGVPLVAAKLGARGSMLSDRGARHVLPALPVDARDTTGSGDAYVAGFVVARLRGAPPEVCGRLGNALGALVATRPGAASALPTGAELRAFLAHHAALAELSVLSSAPGEPVRRSE
ncbi:carbohydrate kinase family protein [Polyangium aurulentum]|uniref:carbohydrate kinase family protein n=1 Tax=Polyangium aurulentum TaxID=2567896 RepID=UPI0010AE1369|nr:carbohydrate kinase family protein [Polyangium aurulentum]UQA58696.1 carbohydrate kinase family protein [Polyangium aurulentum]